MWVSFCLLVCTHAILIEVLFCFKVHILRMVGGPLPQNILLQASPLKKGERLHSEISAKVDLNMNPACSACLCMNKADAWFCLLTLLTPRAWGLQ